MAKHKRKKTRTERIYTMLLLAALGLSIIVSLIVSSGTGKFNLNLFALLTIIFLIVFATIFIILSLPSVKGKIGESKVSKVLTKLAYKYDGAIFNNIIIPGTSDKTSQIDHIYVSKFGVFVVETKNYAGRIYGNDGQNEWTQVLAYGNSKAKLYNPVKQNQTHIYRLKQLLNIDVALISVIVFTRADLSNIKSDYVYSIRDLKHILDGRKIELTREQVIYVTNTIRDYKLNPVKTDREHIKEVKQTMRGVNSNSICPRCGGTLVLRKGTNGSFYGCSNYPKCKFTKKA